jgi:hypothetical protein
MSRIYISYRRTDAAPYAGRLFDHLSRHFGRGFVFMDIQGGIAPGQDFTQAIDAALNTCDVALVLIGKHWATSTGPNDGLRLDDPNDWVRLETAAVLRRNVLVIPVLVDGARLPDPASLPEELRPLCRRNASELTDSRWSYDVGELVKDIEKTVHPRKFREEPPWRWLRLFRRESTAVKLNDTQIAQIRTMALNIARGLKLSNAKASLLASLLREMRVPGSAADAQALIAALGDADKNVRASAAKALSEMGTAAVAAVRQSAEAAETMNPVAPDAEPVDAAVFCPREVVKDSVFLLQVFLYPPGAEVKVDDQARQMDAIADRRGTYSLPLDLPPNTRLDLRLEVPNLIVNEPDAVLIWHGRPTAAQFEVTAPATAPGTEAIGRIRFAVAGVPAGTLRFKIALARTGSVERGALREAEAVRYRRAFVSYSIQDRAEVLRRVQAFRIAGLSVFQDILDIEPGERWAQALYREIDKCDVFLLFWSRAAATSDWVAKEIAYALARKAGDENLPPAIQPVPIEGPPPPPPPETLRHLHFNDALLGHIQAASMPAI